MGAKIMFEHKLLNNRKILIPAGFLLLIHGLIHFLGFIAYWQIAELEDLPYKTTLIFGAIDIGDGGIRVFGLFWVLAGAGYMASVMILALGKNEQARLCIFLVTLLSLFLCLLDFTVCYTGAAFNVLILLGLLAERRRLSLDRYLTKISTTISSSLTR